MSKHDILTVTVPYIPPYDKDIQDPQWFADNIKTFAVAGFPDVKFEDYELEEIQGTRLVKVDGVWVDCGHAAIYRRKEGE